MVPLIPNDDTPARRTRSPRTHSRSTSSNRTRPAPHSTFRDGTPAYNERGNTPSPNANTIFITPATPAAACV
ncbi:hypothetical protein PUR25_08720 [Streptomyces sp. JV181]|nr:hypothetical protein [Streptomyces sp. JV181]MEE1776138.1 hypothetical protein [Streptomyces sp. JV181]